MDLDRIKRKFDNEKYHYPLKKLDNNGIRVLAAFDECIELYGKKVESAPSPADPVPFKTYMMKYECLNLSSKKWQAFMTYKSFQGGRIIVETKSKLKKSEWDKYPLENIDKKSFIDAFERTLIAFNRVSRSHEMLSDYTKDIEKIVKSWSRKSDIEKTVMKKEPVRISNAESGHSNRSPQLPNTPAEFPNLYAEAVSCPENCPGVIRDDHTNIPRGFFSQAAIGDSITALLVAQNPGQPMKGHGEWKLYKNLSPNEAVSAHLGFGKKCFVEGGGGRFHNRLTDWLSELLETLPKKAFKSAVYSNVVKCTTPNNMPPKENVVFECARRYLKREIELWHPKVVIALGTNVRRYLQLLQVEHEYLPHPSHRKGSDYHRIYLENIKKKIGKLG